MFKERNKTTKEMETTTTINNILNGIDTQGFKTETRTSFELKFGSSMVYGFGEWVDNTTSIKGGSDPYSRFEDSHEGHYYFQVNEIHICENEEILEVSEDQKQTLIIKIESQWQ